jgi:uncharacterized protein (TIGR03067 family)
MRYCVIAALGLVLVSLAGCKQKNQLGTDGDKQVSTPAPAAADKRNSPQPAAANPNDPSAKEHARLLGTWNVVDGETQGVRMDPAAVKDNKWTFTADKVTYTEFGKNVEATYRFNPGTTPPSYDFKGPSTAIQGIYELKGDILKVCFAATNRPTAFATAGTSQDTLLFILKRAPR